MQTEDQAATIAFLESAAADTQRIDTHISIVLLSGERVWKLKRAVKLPYLDFSTPELRLAVCETELELNCRTAPALYLGVRKITRETDGGLAFDGTGELVDAIVEMRRFAQTDLFDTMAKEGRLTSEILTRLARTIAAFHDECAWDFSRSGSQAVESALLANEGGFSETRLFDPEKVARLFNLCRARLDHFRAILVTRGLEGKVRRCHGDLHLRNICLFDGKPVLFDCLEFDENLATTDILYDLAFLLMDLVHRGLQDDANLVFNRYLDETGDEDALALLPFFMSIRAAVRAHVGASAAREDASKIEEARQYLDLALDLLHPREPRLVAVGGLSGSGKSSVASRLAPQLDLMPGARILSTDRIRKKLAHVPAEEKLPPETYTPETSQSVYAVQRAQAARILTGGWSVIADAVFLKPGERSALEDIAHDFHMRFDGLWLDAPREILAERVAKRVNDPSDANVAVLDRQLGDNPGALGWHRVDASGDLDATAREALQALS